MMSLLLCYHENAKRPPIGSGSVTLPVDHLWRHVLHRPTEREGLFVFYCLFTQAKVCAGERERGGEREREGEKEKGIEREREGERERERGRGREGERRREGEREV